MFIWFLLAWAFFDFSTACIVIGIALLCSGNGAGILLILLGLMCD